MNDDVLIKVEGVSKKFCKSLKKSMLYGVEDITRDTFNLKTTPDKLRKGEFWAVDNVSFEVKRGECLGIIGHNGAGKSTLLKMLNGIFMPDKGTITIKGKVGALIEVGAGFHPMLTGRENIYVNGAILGMSKEEIDNKFDEIVAFSELDEFIDMPVKHYSSGMYVRLGFAIAIQVKPDVLILDEVLAVGDVGFRAKCYNSIAALMAQSAVILVSHSMESITRICDKCILIDSGKATFKGDAIEASNLYVYSFNSKERLSISTKLGFIFNDFSCNPKQILIGQNIDVDITFYSPSIHNGVLIKINFFNTSGNIVAEFNTHNENIQVNIIIGQNKLHFCIKNIRLLSQRYNISFAMISERTSHLIWLKNIETLDVIGDVSGHQSYQLEGVNICEQTK